MRNHWLDFDCVLYLRHSQPINDIFSILVVDIRAFGRQFNLYFRGAKVWWDELSVFVLVLATCDSTSKKEKAMESMENWLGHGILTAVFVSLMLFRVYLPRRLEPSTPSELTTLGILGTFTGIFLGLVPFAVSGGADISKNIPGLIAGIGVATVCSIVGMFLALLSKDNQRAWKVSQEATSEDQHDGATADTLANLLQELIQQSKIQNSNLAALQKSIAGDEDGTLLTQIQKLRTSFSDKQDKMIYSFDSFAEKMAKSNSEALIDALREVIRDFNSKITEQFGDNFKHLNQAVGQLLQWQESYKLELGELQKQFQACVEGIETSEVALSSIAEKSYEIVEASAKLERLLVAYDSYRSSLAEHLDAFASLSQEAQEAFPIIKNNLKTLTEDFSTAVLASTSQIEKTVTQTSKRLEDQVTALDEALQEELTKSLSSLGNQLTSLSGKFVSDYTPLTIQLEKLVRTASVGDNN